MTPGLTNRVKKMARISVFMAALSVLIGLPAPHAQAGSAETTGGDASISALSQRLFERTRFLDVRISPDGAQTAFLYYSALPRTDEIEFTLALSDNNRPGSVTQLARYRLPSSRAMLNQSQPRPSVADFRWSPNGKAVAFVQPSGTGVDLMLWDVRTCASRAVVQGHREVEFSRESISGQLSFVTRDEADPLSNHVSERALRIKDGYDFLGPVVNPNSVPQFRQQRWSFDWTAHVVRPIGEAGIGSGVAEPREYPRAAFSDVRPTGTLSIFTQDFASPDGRAIMRRVYRLANAQSPEIARVGRSFEFRRPRDSNAPVRVTSEADDVCRMDPIGWSRDSSTFVFLEHCEAETVVVRVDRNGAHRVVLRAPAQLDFGDNGLRDDPSTQISSDGRFVVLVRSRTFYAADLVLVDLGSGQLSVLAAPNGEQPVTTPVKTIVLKPSTDIMKARLYLPDRSPGTKIPMVIALYYSSPGLEASTGDEIPILPLVKSGVAVMTFDAQNVDASQYNGDPRWELARVERPRIALEQLIEQSVRDYGVDRDRVGISGLSFGAEIATYVYWKSDKFRAVSSAGAGVSPTWLILGGQGYATRMESRGLPEPESGADPVWRAVSTALNARANLPPLLWQTPDSERLGSVEAWYRLRRVGAQVEWWDYPDETHRKLGAADLWLTQQRNYDWFRFWLQDFEDPDPSKIEQYQRWRGMREAWRQAAGRRSQGN